MGGLQGGIGQKMCLQDLVFEACAGCPLQKSEHQPPFLSLIVIFCPQKFTDVDFVADTSASRKNMSQEPC